MTINLTEKELAIVKMGLVELDKQSCYGRQVTDLLHKIEHLQLERRKEGKYI